MYPDVYGEFDEDDGGSKKKKGKKSFKKKGKEFGDEDWDEFNPKKEIL